MRAIYTMIVSFTAIEPSLEIREFSCSFPKLEMALDVLSRIVGNGDKMLSVKVIDETNQIQLPPEAFDGQPMAEAIQALEEQWQDILQKPVQSKVVSQNLRIDVARQQLSMYDRKIHNFTHVVDHFELLRQQTEREFQYDPIKAKLLGRYDKMLATYRQYVARAEASREVVLKKLNQLEHSYCV